MIIETLTRTPRWVWLLLCVLLVYGFTQSRRRNVPYRRALILPGVMLGVSLSGVIGQFGGDAGIVVLWLAGVVSALVLNRWLSWPWGVRYTQSDHSFVLLGTWFPLALIVSIFGLRYFVGVASALHLEIIRSGLFAALLAWVYGLLGGVFLAGGVRMWRLAHSRRGVGG